ncbi:hypothetical protein NQ314_008413 [Rhamnusium bicolor]|uniref:Iron sulphur domain-containing protein n=1 Tax=Rhamnusium bicolor TaxID=1586634 RepID=A0AAV8YBC6_9CUCU|nr:hypothetical protein NQ314_008413 [Rhamnusium bicolor]
MQPIAYLVKEAVPNYLSTLPIPDSIGGWFRLGFKDWLALIPPTAAAAGFTYITYRAFCPHGRPQPDQKINQNLGMKWPYCDGAHGTHNNETGDNVGPLIVERKK